MLVEHKEKASVNRAQTVGPMWGQKARDWEEHLEPMARPAYERVLSRVGIQPGISILDVGCGAGLFVKMAHDMGASLTGLDLSEPLLTLAEERTPKAEFHLSDMAELPFPDASFDIITAFNSVQFAPSPVDVLNEVRRVVRPGGKVAITVWGHPEECEAAGFIMSLREFLPPDMADSPDPFALSVDGSLASMVRDAELSPVETEDVECPLVYPDLATALTGLMSPAPAVMAVKLHGERKVRDSVIRAIAPYRTNNGGYRMTNKFRCLISSRQA